MNLLHKAQCNQCSVKSDNKVFPYESEDPDVVIVGEAPGRREEAKGIPFIGRSGELLWKFIEASGIDTKRVSTTNLLLCRPPENRTPTKKEINNCSGRLEAYLQKVDPDYIVTVGATAGQYMLNTSRGVKDIRGRVYWDEDRSSYILPTLHPAACLRARQLARDLLNDIQKLHRCLDGWNPPKIEFENPAIPEELQTDYTLIKNLSEAKELFEWFYREKELLSFDLETSGFDFRNDYVLCMGIAYERGKAVILHEQLFDNQEFLNYLNEWFDRDLKNDNPNFYHATPKILWQNGKFDLKFMRDTLGITNARVDRDSMLEHYTLDERKGEKSKDGREEGRGVHNLQYLAGFYLNAPEYEDEFKQYVEDSYADAPKPELHQYCAYDVDYSRRMHKDHLTKEMDEDLKGVEETLLVPGTNMLSDVERRGMKVHKPRIRTKRQEYKKKLNKMEKQLANLAKSVGFSTSRYVDETDAKSEPDMLNPRSPKQMAYVLIDVLNLPKYHGERTTKEDALLHWEDLVKGEDNKREKFINELLNYRKQHKLYSQYLKGMEKHIEDDGRVKSSMNLHGTSSGRLSCLAEYERVQIKGKGLIPIKDVEIGDYIEAPGGWKKVKRKACTGEKQVYRIKTSCGLELDVSNNHLFRTIEGKWKQTDELTITDNLCQLMHNEDAWINMPIESIEKLDKKETMYEIAVEDSVYCKQGIIMHNSSQPNLQNISRESDIRNIFCPPDGWDLVEVDLSQAELRTLAVLSQDPFLLEAYEDGGDLHDTMAEELFGPDFKYEDRQVAKTVNFGIVYDQSAPALAEALGISKDKAKSYINTFFTNASKAKEWLEKKSKEPFQEGITPTSYFGRQMRFTLLTKHKIGNIKRTARNFPIQSAASDLHLLSGVEVWKHTRHRDDAFIVNLVHDSMLLEIKKESTAEVAQFAKDTMEKTSREALNSSIPFKADVEASDYGWGALKEKQDDESWENFLVRARKC